MGNRQKALYNDDEQRENLRHTRRKHGLTKFDPKKIREELYDYFGERRRRLEIVKTTRTPNGQVLDWVPINSQLPSGMKLATPPSESVPLELGSGRRRVKPVRFELEHYDAARGPEGTVPIPRRDLKRLRFVRPLRDHLSKHGHRSYTMFIDERDSVEVPADGSAHEYAYSSQWVTCYGADGNLAAFDPYLHRSDEFSLLQVAVTRGSGSGKQTIEAGWQEFRDLYGDWVPHLFVFYTTNGYTESGDNKGGYNRDVDGWVQYSDVVYPEAISSPNSTRGGAQYIMQIKYQLYQGNWWFCCNGRWIGYYPSSLFSTSGLRSQAEKVAFYGEVVDSAKDAGSSWTDMGSGYWPENHWTWSAYMSNLRYQSGTGGSMSSYSGSTWESNPDEYGIESHFDDTGSWGSHCWLGGPGGG
ncbi:MAG TPA: neprosin family prolyl endopeptidase [Pyrinomonadaceae bacterium]